MTYPSTPHPEDSPGFEGYPQYPQGTPDWAQESVTTRGTGKADVPLAIGWAFKAVFRNWPIWIIGALVWGLIIGGLSVGISLATTDFSASSEEAMMQNSWTDWLVNLVQFFIMPFLLTGALVQVSKERISLGDFFRDVAYLRVLAVSILQFVVAFALIVVVALVAIPIFIAANPPTAVIVVFALLAFLGAMLLTPFFSFWSWYAADGNGIVDSIGLGIKAGKRNYLQVLLLTMLGSLVMVVGIVITLGLGALILAPAMHLSMAHIYRQASGGELPAA